MVALARLHRFTPEMAIQFVQVLGGVFIYAVLAAGLGALGTNLFSQDRKKKSPAGQCPISSCFFASLYAYAIYAPDPWSRFTFTVLVVFLAWGVWQKVRDHAPYFLDPIEEPPPRLTLNAGLTAVLIFDVLDGLIRVFLKRTADLSPGASLFWGYILSGLITGGFALWILTARGHPEPLRAGGPRASGRARSLETARRD